MVYGVSRTKMGWGPAKKFVDAPKQFHLARLDVSAEVAVRKYVRRLLKSVGKIDLLINNAGFATKPIVVENESLRSFQHHLTQNLLSVFLVCKYVLPHMKREQSGLIVNISSMAGKRAVPQMSAYSASKFGVIALSQSIAKENLAAGIKCFSVCPGGMNTTMRAKVFGKEDAAKQQSAKFVAQVVMRVITGELHVESGGDIAIRHGKVSQINPMPAR